MPVNHTAKEAPASVHFAIVLCLFEREHDPFFALPRMTSIRSLEVQTHPNWHAVVRGDGLAGPALPRARQMLRQSAIPADNIDWANLPAGEREAVRYKGDRHLVWLIAGARCLNAALDTIASSRRGATHVARLDDDDRWAANHLQHLAAAFLQVPRAGFAYTQSAMRLPSVGVRPKRVDTRRPAACTSDRTPCRLLLVPPIPCTVTHSTVSWALDSRAVSLRYRDAEQQLAARRLKKEHRPIYNCNGDDCGRDLCGNSTAGYDQQRVWATDADMWDRMWDLQVTQGLVSVLVPRVTVTYTGVVDKRKLLQAIFYCSNRSELADPLGSILKCSVDLERRRLHRMHGRDASPMKRRLQQTHSEPRASDGCGQAHAIMRHNISRRRTPQKARNHAHRATQNATGGALMMRRSAQPYGGVQTLRTLATVPLKPLAGVKHRDYNFGMAGGAAARGNPTRLGLGPALSCLNACPILAVLAVLAVSATLWYVRELRRADGERFTSLARRGSLITAVAQNSFGILWLRHGRTAPGSRDDPAAVVVLLAEVLKLLACLSFLLIARGGPTGMLHELREAIWRRKLDTLKLCVPSGCYAIGNNLQFVAAQHLSAVMLHMVERTKVLGTACFGVIILQTSLRSNQWLALLLIVVGVFLAQSHHEEASDGQPTPNVFLGICAALAVSLVSSFSGVWLELVLKSDQTPLALRNVQLALYSIPLQLLVCHHFGHPLLVPLSWISSLLAINLAFAGLLVATIVRFADNNLKNLAQALATIVSALASIPLFGFQPNLAFGIGAALVVGGVFLWAAKCGSP